MSEFRVATTCTELHHLQVHVAYLVVKYMAYGAEFETEELQPADTASGWKNATKGKGTKREDAVWKYFRRIEGFRAQVSISCRMQRVPEAVRTQKGNTTNLMSHLKTMHLKKCKKEDRKPKKGSKLVNRLVVTRGNPSLHLRLLYLTLLQRKLS